MVARRPLVVQDGYIAELPLGDTVAVAAIQVVAGSGLVGGGSVSTNPRVDLALAPNPSGVIYVGDAVGLDGVAQELAYQASFSGYAGLQLGVEALSSGVAAQATASTALASGNAALSAAANFSANNSVVFTAASTVASGNAVGLDDTGRVQIIQASSPTIGGQNNFIGTAQASVSSGTSVRVLLPQDIDYNRTGGLTPGLFYFLNTTGGFTTSSGQPATWSGAYTWGPVAKAVSSSGLLLLNPL